MAKKETIPEILDRLLANNDEKSIIEYNKIILMVRRVLQEELQNELKICESKEEYEKCAIIKEKIEKYNLMYGTA